MIQGMEKYILKNDTQVSAVVQKGVFTLLLLFQFWPQRGCAAVPSSVSLQGQGPHGGQKDIGRETRGPSRTVLGALRRALIQHRSISSEKGASRSFYRTCCACSALALLLQLGCHVHLTDREATSGLDLDSLHTEHADIPTDARTLVLPGARGELLQSCHARCRGLGLRVRFCISSMAHP